MHTLSLSITEDGIKLNQPTKRLTAFTLIELVVVIAIIALLAGMLLPPTHCHTRRPYATCMNNLKQISMALQMYSADHATLMPWQHFRILADTNSARIVEQSNLPAWQYADRISRHLYDTNTPGYKREFICPQDIERTVTPDKPKRPIGNQTLSYFIGLNEARDNSGVIVMGDRNLSPGKEQPLYSSAIGRPVIVDTNTTIWSFMKTNKFHANGGCLLFADGHVEYLQVLPTVLTGAVKVGGTNANRFLFPQ